MASIINTSSFQSDLLPLVKKWFGDEYADYPMFYDKMMQVEQADERNFQIDALVETMGLLVQKDEGNSLEFDYSREGFKPTYQHITYALGFIITMEMLEDGDAFKNAMRFTKQLKFSAMQTKEIIAANVYNNAFNSSYTMTNGDNQAMISTAHPVIGGTQSNLITGGSVDMSEAAIEQLTIDTKNTLNSRGLRIMTLPERLICSVTDEPLANRILLSPLQANSADNNINYLKNSGLVPGGIVASPFLTGTHAFFLTNNIPDGVKFLVRKDATIDDGNDFDSKNNKFSVIMRISAGWSDWRQVRGSNGP
jgi:hypothetical protein